MPRTMLTSLALLLVSLILIGCSWSNALIPTPFPSPTPTCAASALILTATATTIKVGETVTLTAKLISAGGPRYKLRLSSGGSMTYKDGTLQMIDDAIFEMVSAQGDQFTLRGKQAGEADVGVGADVELGCYNTGYSWGSVGSGPLHLTVIP